MSLNAIFDPMVRSYFDDNDGDSGGGNITVIQVTDEQMANVVSLPTLPTELTPEEVWCKVSDRTPTVAELENLICLLPSSGNNRSNVYGVIGASCVVTEDEEIGTINCIGNGSELFFIIPQSTADMITNMLGIETQSGFYFNRADIASGVNPVLIYGQW